MILDTIIKNGIIIDGTKKEMFKADLGIKDGKIKRIGDLERDKAERIIDAEGLYVTPGFIDISNHSDGYWTIFNIPKMDSMVKQGVTTIVCGNCGASVAPITRRSMIYSIRKWSKVDEFTVDWTTVDEFLSELEKRKIAVNFITLVGHSTLKRGVIGDEARDLTEEEFRVVNNMLEKSLEDGCFGLSTGLIYSHEAFTKVDELVALSNTVSKYGGFYSSHIRNEGAKLVEAVQEVLDIGKKSTVSVEISHLKAKGKKSWKNMDSALKRIESAKSQGVDVNFDVSPYTASGSVLYTYLPDWVSKGGRKEMLDKLRNPDMRAKIIKEMKKDEHNYSDLIISMAPYNKSLVGKKIREMAQAEELDIEEVVINTLIAANGHVICFDHTVSEKNIQMLIKHPLCMIGTDGVGYDIEHSEEGELVHPRCFGTFPRFLGRYVRDQKLLSWEEAIHKITFMPAKKIGLKDRGIIKEGMKADICMFNPYTVIDRATFENPYQYPEGIEHVMVNGDLVVVNREHTNILPGEIIRRK